MKGETSLKISHLTTWHASGEKEPTDVGATKVEKHSWADRWHGSRNTAKSEITKGCGVTDLQKSHECSDEKRCAKTGAVPDRRGIKKILE